MEMTTQQIEQTYIDALLNGEKTVTVTSTETPNGVITQRAVKRVHSAKNCLEYLRTMKPEKWSPPPPVQQVMIKQETINTGVDELRKLLTFVPKEE